MLNIEFERKKEIALLETKIGNGKIKIVAGLRRAGKSYLLDPLFKRFLVEKKGYREENFAIKDFSKQDEINDVDGLKKYLESLLGKSEVKFIFLDEAQECGFSFAEAVLKFHHMHGEFDIYLTGSNSKTLSEDIVENFKDDGDPIFIDSLSYKEIVDKLPSFTLEDYFETGGLPVIARQENKHLRVNALDSLLRNLYFTDIKNRLQKKCSLKKLAPSEAEDVIRDVCANLASPMSIAGLAKRCGGKGRGRSSIDKNDFSLDCLSILKEAENAYLLYRYAYPYSDGQERNPRAWVSHQFKYYCYDLGLLERISLVDDPCGIALENAVYLELRRRGIKAWPFILFDERGNEETNIDFAFSYKGQNVLLQVNYEINVFDEEREVKKLASIEGDYRKCIVYKHNLLGDEEDSIDYIQSEDFFLNFI